MSEISMDKARNFDTGIVECTMGFRVSAEVMPAVLGEKTDPHAAAVYELARRLVDSVRFTWKPGDDEVEFTVSFRCLSPKDHVHEGAHQ